MASTDITQYQHGRVPRDVRRAQIAELAEELFAERGFQGLAMDELARRAGVTKPVIYEIFGSKEGLYRACVEHTAAELAAGVSSAATAVDDPLAQLRAGVTAWFAFAAEHRRAWEILYSGDARFADAMQTIRARQAELVAALLTGIAQSRDVHVDPRQMQATAHVINGATEALAMWGKDHPDLSPEDLAEWTVQVIGPGLTALTNKDNT
jgi:AcrR family transcriptional regulator